MAEFEVVHYPFRLTVSIKDHALVAEIPEKMRKNFKDLISYIQRNEIEITGHPFTFFRDWSFRGVEIESGYPVAGEVRAGGRIRSSNLPSVRAATALHEGPYEDLREVYSRMERWMLESGLTPAPYFWEEYLTDPLTTDPKRMVVSIIWPIK